MSRWERLEIEHAFDHYQAAALKGAQTKDWTDWAACFTEDATHFEHHYGIPLMKIKAGLSPKS